MKAARVFALGSLVAGALIGTRICAQQHAPLTVLAQPSGAISYTLTATPGATDLAQQYVKAENEETKKDLRKRMTDLLNQQFDSHAEHQQKELEDLEKQITHLKSVLKKRQEAKTTIVDRRLEQLIHEAEGLGWNAPNSPSMGGFHFGSPPGPPALYAPRTAPANKKDAKK